MGKINLRRQKSIRQRRIRVKFRGTSERPRLSVFRSNKAVYAQLIDDLAGRTLVAVSSRDLVKNKKKILVSLSKVEAARQVGRILAKESLKKGIKKVVFDRGSYRYHGRVKALAEGAREGGLKF